MPPPFRPSSDRPPWQYLPCRGQWGQVPLYPSALSKEKHMKGNMRKEDLTRRELHTNPDANGLVAKPDTEMKKNRGNTWILFSSKRTHIVTPPLMRAFQNRTDPSLTQKLQEDKDLRRLILHCLADHGLEETDKIHFTLQTLLFIVIGNLRHLCLAVLNRPLEKGVPSLLFLNGLALYLSLLLLLPSALP